MTTSYREALAQTLLEEAAQNKRLMILTPDLAKALRMDLLTETYPNQYVSMGISEGNMVGVAAGLAAAGMLPVICGFAMFVAERPYEQIRNIIAYPELNVKIFATHGGLCVGRDGATHQAAEDIGMMRMLPHFSVLTACDVAQTQSAVKAALAHEGAVYLRLGRDKSKTVYENGCTYEIGKSDVLRDGSDVAIFAAGTMVAKALEAAETLRNEGVSAAVINLYSIKPFDQETVLRYAKTCGRIVTVEDHSKFGGLGSTIAEYLAKACPTPISFVGVDDVFGESGDENELYEEYGLDAKSIVSAGRSALERG